MSKNSKIEPFDLNFLSYLFTLNCKASSIEKSIKHQISVVPTPRMIQRKAPLISDDTLRQYHFEIELIADPRYDSEKTALEFLKEFDQVFL